MPVRAPGVPVPNPAELQRATTTVMRAFGFLRSYSHAALAALKEYQLDADSARDTMDEVIRLNKILIDRGPRAAELALADPSQQALFSHLIDLFRDEATGGLTIDFAWLSVAISFLSALMSSHTSRMLVVKTGLQLAMQKIYSIWRDLKTYCGRSWAGSILETSDFPPFFFASPMPDQANADQCLDMARRAHEGLGWCPSSEEYSISDEFCRPVWSTLGTQIVPVKELFPFTPGEMQLISSVAASAPAIREANLRERASRAQQAAAAPTAPKAGAQRTSISADAMATLASQPPAKAVPAAPVASAAPDAQAAPTAQPAPAALTPPASPASGKSAPTTPVSGSRRRARDRDRGRDRDKRTRDEQEDTPAATDLIPGGPSGCKTRSEQMKCPSNDPYWNPKHWVHAGSPVDLDAWWAANLVNCGQENLIVDETLVRHFQCFEWNHEYAPPESSHYSKGWSAYIGPLSPHCLRVWKLADENTMFTSPLRNTRPKVFTTPFCDRFSSWLPKKRLRGDCSLPSERDRVEGAPTLADWQIAGRFAVVAHTHARIAWREAKAREEHGVDPLSGDEAILRGGAPPSPPHSHPPMWRRSHRLRAPRRVSPQCGRR